MFRLLVRAGGKGMPAGAVASALDLAPNTLSFHFDRLRQAGLVTCTREGRSLIYAAKYDTMNGLLAYLTENCCEGVAARLRARRMPPRCRDPQKEREGDRMSAARNLICRSPSSAADRSALRLRRIW